MLEAYHILATKGDIWNMADAIKREDQEAM